MSHDHIQSALFFNSRNYSETCLSSALLSLYLSVSNCTGAVHSLVFINTFSITALHCGKQGWRGGAEEVAISQA